MLNKIQIQKAFQKKGLYSKRCLYLNQGTGYQDAINTIDTSFIHNSILVIRTSGNAGDLNLPRLISKDFNIIDNFLKKYLSNYDLIIQEYFRINLSFEIYFYSNTRIICEIMPGIWESSMVNPPDVLIIENNIINYKIYKNSRKCLFINEQCQYEKELVVQRDIKFYRQIIKTIKNKLATLISFLEENRDYDCFHAVADDKIDLQFINARKIGNIEENKKETFNDVFYIINSIEDIKKISNPNIKILFNVAKNREDTKEIITIAKELAKYTNIVYVTFGLLSHQSIILRELNFSVIQISIDYEFITEVIDVG